MKMMITGAGGFLGSRLAAFYAGREPEAGADAGAESVQDSAGYEVWGVGHGELDFAEERQVQRAVRAFAPDVVIHCGAISDVGACERDPALSKRVNVDGTRWLARAAAKAGARFVFCSSDQVYFGKSDVSLQPHKEREILDPRPVYGQHKLLAEQACLAEQPDSVILRLTWMYDILTETERQKDRRNLAAMAEEALRTGQPLYASETDHRGVTDVRKVVEQMACLWQLPAGIYNYGSSNDTNMYETMRRVFAALGRPELVQKAAAGGLRNLTMDVGKTEAAGILFPNTAEGLLAFLRERGF